MKDLDRQLLPYGITSGSAGTGETASTTNLVPLILTDTGRSLRDGELSDLAPTILGLLGLAKPLPMSGANLTVTVS